MGSDVKDILHERVYHAHVSVFVFMFLVMSVVFYISFGCLTSIFSINNASWWTARWSGPDGMTRDYGMAESWVKNKSW